jgi:serine/threonine protein phosphatase PrpC
MELKISVLSKPGGRAVNEDAYGFWAGPDCWFCALSDGVGGHAGGDVASKLVVQQIMAWFYRQPDASGDNIAAALRAANAALVAEQRRCPELADMRATILVLALDTRRATAIWGHIGDTRLYCFRGKAILSQTRDHSVVQSMVDAGYLAPGDVRSSPNRNALLAALGDARQFDPRIEAAPLPLRDGDLFLLCTDGFWEYVEEADMEQGLQVAQAPEAWLQRLERMVVQRGRPGQDNYSALVVACSDPCVTQRM